MQKDKFVVKIYCSLALNLYKATSKMSELFPDGIHPNEQGAGVIATKVRKAVLKEKKKIKNKL